MLDRNDVMQKISGRISTLGSSDMCALFLLSVEKKDGGDAELNLDETAERISSLLARFFRITDIVGYAGNNMFVAFLTGNIPDSVIWEKAGTLAEALWITAGETPADSFYSNTGVYLFRFNGESCETIFRKAEYALEMARKNINRHFYIYTTVRDGQGFNTDADVPSYQPLLNYINESVRIFKVRDEITTEYTNYFGHHDPDGGEQNRVMKIHPADAGAFEADVREIAAKGGQKESGYRISRDGTTWTYCRVNLFRLADRHGDPIVMEIAHDVSALELLKHQHDEDNEWLDFLAKKTDCELWELNIPARTFRLLYFAQPFAERESVYGDFPESLIENGKVHKDSTARFRIFAQEILSGKTEGSGNFIIQSRISNSYTWASMTYRTLYDEEGRPEKAIGIKEDLSYPSLRFVPSLNRRPVPPEIYPHLYCYCQANLSADSIEKLLIEGHNRIKLTRNQTYSSLLEHSHLRLFSLEAGKQFQQRFSRDHLLEKFNTGRRWFSGRCQIIDSEGNIQWMNIGVNLTPDPESGDVILFAYLSLCNEQRKWENEVEHSAENNGSESKSVLYSRGTAELMVRNCLNTPGQTDCAFVEILAEGADAALADPGSGPVIWDLETALYVFLDTDCIIWRKNNRALQAFFPDAGAKTALRKRLEDAFCFARLSMSDIPAVRALRFIAGAAYSQAGSLNYKDMKSTAAHLCDIHASEPADTVIFSEQSHFWENERLSDLEADGLTVETPDGRQELSGQEKNILITCLTRMLKAETVDRSVNAVLSLLGAYYQASRVYILALTEHGRILNMLNEWVGHGRHSIQHSISGKPTSRFPVIANYLKDPRPLVLSKNEDSAPGAGDSGNPDRIWKYTIFPMGKTADAERLLCIENPQNNTDRTALLYELLPLLAAERKRFLNAGAAAGAQKKQHIMRSQQEYESTVHTISSDTYSSLGVLTIDIPDFNNIYAKKDYDYVNRFIQRIAEVLQDVFNGQMLFHTKINEFIVLSTNVTYRVFLNQCARAKQLIGRKFSSLFRLGCTWSDGVFSGPDLVKKALSIMECTPVSPHKVAPVNQEQEWENILPGVVPVSEQENRGRQFTIFLQPKVDMRTEELVGAEALIRVMDDTGALIPHGPIIEKMEKNGTIQKLDFFVFDKALSTLEDWKNKGYDIKPISSNFSRKTLLNPTALASVLAILSRYPDVTPDKIELEITETAGSLENNTLSELFRRFGEYGLEFALDDFGSSYSNMSMLADLHFRSVKLDRSMVKSVTTNPISRMMIRDIVRVCEKCNMHLVAEGVETQTQADILIEDGCFCAQGYYYSRPVSVAEFEQKYFSGKYGGGGKSESPQKLLPGRGISKTQK